MKSFQVFRFMDGLKWNNICRKKNNNGRQDLDSKLSVKSHWWGSFPNNPYESRIWYNYVLILNVACSANNCIKIKRKHYNSVHTVCDNNPLDTFLLPDNEIISIDTDYWYYNIQQNEWITNLKKNECKFDKFDRNNAFNIYELGCDQNDVPINWN